MSELPEKVEIAVWGPSERVLSFGTTGDILTWVEQEIKNWTFTANHRTGWLSRVFENQRNSLSVIENNTRGLEQLLQQPQPHSAQVERQTREALNNVRYSFAPITQGSLLTSEHPAYRFISDLATRDGDAAALLLASSRSDSTQVLNNLGGPAPIDAVVRMGIELIERGKEGKDIAAYRRHLASVNNESQKVLSALRDKLNHEEERSNLLAGQNTSRVEQNGIEWSALIERCGKDWAALKEVYDEKLSLLAPTEYWKTQNKQYMWQSIAYAIAFGLAIGASVALFAILGIPELKQVKPAGTSVVVAILPVIVPAFAGIWILRILGRQLAESLAIMKDAKERVTLVKTFLALMRDENEGKAPVKDEDRGLILHALFRQSRVTAVDDSPPLTVFDSVFKFLRHPS